MANHKATKKSIRKIAARNKINRNRLNRIRTMVKKLEKLITGNEAAEAKNFFTTVQSELMKGVSKGIMKKNTASRKISRLAYAIKKLSA